MRRCMINIWNQTMKKTKLHKNDSGKAVNDFTLRGDISSGSFCALRAVHVYRSKQDKGEIDL